MTVLPREVQTVVDHEFDMQNYETLHGYVGRHPWQINRFQDSFRSIEARRRRAEAIRLGIARARGTHR